MPITGNWGENTVFEDKVEIMKPISTAAFEFNSMTHGGQDVRRGSYAPIHYTVMLLDTMRNCPPPPPPYFIAFFGGYMPRKSTICHQGDIFVHPKTMRCNRVKNALYGHLCFCFFVDFGSQNTINLSKIYRKALT